MIETTSILRNQTPRLGSSGNSATPTSATHATKPSSRFLIPYTNGLRSTPPFPSEGQKTSAVTQRHADTIRSNQRFDLTDSTNCRPASQDKTHDVKAMPSRQYTKGQTCAISWLLLVNTNPMPASASVKA